MRETLLTVSDAAKVLNLSGASVRNFEQRGILQAQRTPSGVRLFRESDVIELQRKRAAKEQAAR